MKNISLILNIVLLVAVAVLFYLQFSGKKTEAVTADGGVPSDVKIAYINSDTVLKYYDYLKAMKEILEAKTKRLDDDFRNRAQGLKNEFDAYQRNVNNMTLGQVKAAEEDLAKKQQNLQLYQQRLGQEVMLDEEKLNRELYTRVTSFLEKYSKEKGFHVVLKKDPTSDVMFATNVLDISQDVINGLNEEYKKEKGGTQPADSTSVKK
jgi:outer membrane protein